MHKTLIISIVGIAAVVAVCAYSLHSLYQHEIKDVAAVCDENFQRAIDGEYEYRHSGTPINLNNPGYIIKDAKDMTPEERASLKGDTITIDEAMVKNLGANLFEILQQQNQDDLMDTNPLNLHNLDSLYGWYLQKAELEIPYCLYLYNNKKEVAESIERDLPFFSAHAKTEMKPIGTQGRMYVQAEVSVPMSDLVRQLFYVLLLFTAVLLVVVVCFAIDLRVIRRQRKALREREEAIYHPLHDLKAPLNSAYAAFGSMVYFETDEEKKQKLRTVQEGIRELSNDLESVLSLMKNGGKNSLNIGEVDLPSLVRECSDALALLYAEKEPNVRIETVGLSEPVRSDAILLKRIVRNLVENAMKYSDKGVFIEIAMRSCRSRFEIRVQDNGWGIPEKDLKKIGRQFYRVARPEGMAAQEGFGIGLACVKKLCKDLGGELEIWSSDGYGSMFTAKLKNFHG